MKGYDSILNEWGIYNLQRKNIRLLKLREK